MAKEYQEGVAETADPVPGSAGTGIDKQDIGDAIAAGQDAGGAGSGESCDGEKGVKGRRGKKPDSEPDIPLGAIRIIDGTEQVKIGPDDWRPVVRLNHENQDDGVRVRIRNRQLKGHKIILGNGTTAAFDTEGIIEVDGKEAARLLTIPGYEGV